MSNIELLQKKWHSLEPNEIFNILSTSDKGLSEDEAHKRLSIYGYNKLKPPKKQSEIVRFLMQFHNVFIYVLLASSVITFLLKDYVDTVVIVGVVVLNALIGYIQEGKAQKAVEAIRASLTLSATVIRNGEKRTIAAEELVPGDVVLIQSGDKVPADLRLFWVKDLKIQEAALTGESVPVDKKTSKVNEDTNLGDRFCMAYSGSLVTYGQGLGVVVSTGDNTEIGKISKLMTETTSIKTPLIVQMDNLAQYLTFLIIIVALGTMLFGYYVRDISLKEIFMAAVALAVAAIPEGLPAVITIILALGVQRMAKKNAIIRNLPSVETLGSCTVICTDKTGTLTKNEMTVTSIFTSKNNYRVTGAGYDPKGDLLTENENKISWEEDNIIKELIYAGYLCNDSNIKYTDKNYQITGDPTEVSLLVLGFKSNLISDDTKNLFKRIDTIPFESERKYMAVLCEKSNGDKIIYVKGSPEKILELASYQEVKEGVYEIVNKDYWLKVVDTIAERGERTLALAYKKVDKNHSKLIEEDLSGLVILGIVGIIDPVREEAITAIKECHEAGITVKMITGDHAKTAAAIGKILGITDGKMVVTGKDLDKMNELEMRFAAKEVNVFARVSPEHKLKLVDALQANGEIAAMTGDGVNDAPALKKAAIGIAMGKTGTEAAKEASDMVLADDNFATIAHAVKEGRTVYDNIRKALMFALPTNGAQAGMIIVAIFANTLLPSTPLQILWINLVTSVTLALALSFEKSEKDVMKRKPRKPNENILSFYMIWRVSYISVLMVLISLGVFLWETKLGVPIDMARTIAVNCLIILQCFYLINCSHMHASSLNILNIFKNNLFIPLTIVTILFLQIIFTYTPIFNKLFTTVPLRLEEWIRLFGFGVVLFLIVELEKSIFTKFKDRFSFA